MKRKAPKSTNQCPKCKGYSTSVIMGRKNQLYCHDCKEIVAVEK